MTGDPFYHDDQLEPVAEKKPRSKKKHAEAPGTKLKEPTPLDFDLAWQLTNDYGNGQRLTQRMGERLMWIENIGWFAWDGVRWNGSNGLEEAIKLAHETVLCIFDEARAMKTMKDGDKERAGMLNRHAVDSGNMRNINAMLKAGAPYLARPQESLDEDAFVVSCDNGTIALGRDVTLRAADRGDLVTRKLNAKFSKTTDAPPRFTAFLETILPDAELRDFVQRLFGYCLCGSIREQCIFLFYGTGRNGKSTLINVIREVFGDYACVSPINTFLAKRDGGSGADASPDVARLAGGTHLVTASEPNENSRFDESLIKAMTGGEPMTARFLNQNFFTFAPRFKLVVSMNHLPNIRGADAGIWRRIRVVPFTVQIPEGDVDRDLEAKLLDERDGILQWLLTGFEAWMREGLRPPASAIAAVEGYRADQDPVGEFLKDRAEMTAKVDPATDDVWATSAKDLWESYKQWCEDEGLEALKQRSFGSKLTARGLTRVKRQGGNAFYRGVVLRARIV